MARSIDWYASLFPIIVIPIVFTSLATRFPVISIDEIPRPEAVPGPFITPKSFFLFYDNHFLQSNLGVNIPYASLWVLIVVVLIQMLFPSNNRLDSIFDIGINLLVSAGVLWLWVIVNYPTLVLLAEWIPHTIVYTPLAGLLLVPFQRMLMNNFRKRKNDDAPEMDSEASL